MKFRRLTEDDVSFSFTPEIEWIDIFDSFDRDIAIDVAREYNNGNNYAWFMAKVTAQWEGMEGVAYLGGCSYKDEADFKADGAYADLRAEALANLNDQIEELCAKVLLRSLDT